MTTLLHHRPPRAEPAPARVRRSFVDRLWQLLCVVVVALPLASIAAVALLGSELWLVPAALVAVGVAVALSVWT
jgi:hypothetical protein